MAILDFLQQLPPRYPLALLISTLTVLFWIVLLLVPGGDEGEKERLDTRADGDIRSTQHRYPAPITGKTLFLQMNEEYFDAIFSCFVRGLLQAGYTLSDREAAPPLLLPKSTLDALAHEVDRARQEHMRGMGEDIEEDIRYHMQSGRAQTFLMQLIGSCEQLSWKVVPVIKEPEDECASSFSVSP